MNNILLFLGCWLRPEEEYKYRRSWELAPSESVVSELIFVNHNLTTNWYFNKQLVFIFKKSPNNVICAKITYIFHTFFLISELQNTPNMFDQLRFKTSLRGVDSWTKRASNKNLRKSIKRGWLCDSDENRKSKNLISKFLQFIEAICSAEPPCKISVHSDHKWLRYGHFKF